jgi:hypothetical protein
VPGAAIGGVAGAVGGVAGAYTAGKATGMKKRKYGQITKNGHFGRFFHILTVFSVK